MAIVLNVRMGNEEPSVPTSYKEAMDSDAASDWQSAMDAETAHIERNQNWVLEPRPYGVRDIGSKWVFSNKTDGSGALTHRRAQLVANGFSQRIVIDYNEIFASVASYTTFRALPSTISSEDLDYLQLDVRAAFLNGNLEETIYLKQLERFIDPSHLGWIYRLKKALYGLKQASRNLRKKLHEILESIGFHAFESDSCFYLSAHGS